MEVRAAEFKDVRNWDRMLRRSKSCGISDHGFWWQNWTLRYILVSIFLDIYNLTLENKKVHLVTMFIGHLEDSGGNIHEVPMALIDQIGPWPSLTGLTNKTCFYGWFIQRRPPDDKMWANVLSERRPYSLLCWLFHAFGVRSCWHGGGGEMVIHADRGRGREHQAELLQKYSEVCGFSEFDSRMPLPQWLKFFHGKHGNDGGFQILGVGKFETLDRNMNCFL
ncbi:MAG: hypothetical protein HQL07_07355 [Nitrospirae bacterium]|nr:hypothetical protein [Magnetococcales bacterium]HAT49551.1 hypothetical protein [Alphaproteobacteria bacterium]